eukprot:1141729-Pelagomonas_calceolata.AAC.2
MEVCTPAAALLLQNKKPGHAWQQHWEEVLSQQKPTQLTKNKNLLLRDSTLDTAAFHGKAAGSGLA